MLLRSLQTTQASGISNAPQWPSNAMVQLADGRWVPAAQAPQQAPATPADVSQGTGKASPYGVSASSQGEPKAPSPPCMSFPPGWQESHVLSRPACLAWYHVRMGVKQACLSDPGGVNDAAGHPKPWTLA